jgi:WD40 repeat protein
LRQSLASNVLARQRFLREAQAAAAVTHDHVVAIHAVDEAAGVPFIVMEYIVGLSLEERIKKTGALKVQEVLRIGMQAASGLAAAHAQGLVHRDVKPSNILLENGVERVKLTDFGLARAADDAQITQTGVVAGTPEYMSPEQAAGMKLDQRSDLFSLGCVLYAMCTGRSPFRATSALAALRRVSEETPRPIRDLNPAIPDWLVQVIDRLLEKDADKRFQSASDVADLLGTYLAHLQRSPDTPLPPILPAAQVIRASSSMPHRKWPIVVAGGIAVAFLTLVLIGGTMAFMKRKPTLPPSHGVTSSPETQVDLSGSITQGEEEFLPVDLGSAANLDLGGATNAEGNDFANMKTGIQVLNGIPFNVAPKYIHLSGKGMLDFPDRVRDIPVGINADVLHFLQGAQYASPDKGSRIGQYEVQYEDGGTEIIPIITGIDVWDWWAGEPKHTERAELAWVGSNAQTAEADKLLQLFHRAWVNPRPDVTITKIGMSKDAQVHTGPMCVAVTAELSGVARMSGEDSRLDVELDWTTLNLVLQGGSHPMTFTGGKTHTCALEPGSYQAEIILKSPTEEVVVRKGPLNIASGSRIRVFMKDGLTTRTFPEPQRVPTAAVPVSSYARDVAFSPDGETILIACADGTAMLWKTASGGHNTIVLPKTSEKGLRRGVFSPNGELIVLSGEGGTFTVWDAKECKLLRSVIAHEGRICALAFTPDGKKLFTGSTKGPTLKSWDPYTGEAISEIPAHESQVTRISFSSDGHLLASGGGEDGVCSVWDTSTWEKRFSVTASSAELKGVSLTPDGSILATGGAEGVVRLWDTHDGRLIRTFAIDDEIFGVEFVPDGKTLAVFDINDSISLWDAATGELRHKYLAHWSWITSMAVSPNGSRLATGSVDGTVKLWDLSQIPVISERQGPQPEAVFTGFPAGIGGSVAFSPKEDILVAASVWKGMIGWFDPTLCRPIRKPLELGGTLYWGTVRIAPDGKTVVVCPDQKEVQFFDKANSTPRESLTATGKPTNCEFGPEGKTLIVCDYPNGTVESWDVQTSTRQWSVRSQAGKPDSARISPDGSKVAVATATGRLILLDTATGTPLSQPLLHGGAAVIGLDFSPDGNTLASGGADKSLKLWDMTEFTEIVSLRGHIGTITSLAFSPDGKQLVSADVEDAMKYWNGEKPQNAGKIILWDVALRKPLVEFMAHNGGVACVDFSRDGKKIASTGRDGRVLVWSVDRLLQWAEKNPPESTL